MPDQTETARSMTYPYHAPEVQVDSDDEPAAAAGALPALSVVLPLVDLKRDFVPVYQDYLHGLRHLDVRYEIIALALEWDTATLHTLRRFKARGDPLHIVVLNRRFDDATILNLGVHSARADRLLFLTGYQQVAGESIPALVRGLDDADIVLASRQRRDSNFNRLQARVYSTCVSWIAGLRVEDAGCDAKAVHRRVLDEIPMYGDMHRFLPLLAHRAGFTVRMADAQQADADVASRLHAVGTYMRRTLDLLSALFILRFTRRPLRFFGSIGGTIFTAGLIITSYLVFERLALDVPLGDRPALLLSALMMVFGIQILAIGLIGEIVIFTHSKDLKEYAIDRIVNE